METLQGALICTFLLVGLKGENLKQTESVDSVLEISSQPKVILLPYNLLNLQEVRGLILTVVSL